MSFIPSQPSRAALAAVLNGLHSLSLRLACLSATTTLGCAMMSFIPSQPSRAALAAVLNGCFQFVFSELTAFGLPQRDDYAWLHHDEYHSVPAKQSSFGCCVERMFSVCIL